MDTCFMNTAFLYLLLIHSITIFVKKQRRFQRFGQGGWQIESEASRKFSPPPCRGVATINSLTYKHRADI